MPRNYTKILEEAFSKKLNRTVFINEIALPFYKEATPLYETLGTLLCPECHSAELSVVHDRIPYFRTKIGNTHDANCNFIQLPITNRVFSKYIADENNCAEVTRYLREFLEVMFSNPTAGSSKLYVKSFSDADSQANNQRLHSHKILRKNFNNGSLVNDTGVWKLFYGQGYFKYVGDSSFKKQYLHIVSPSSNKTVCCLIIPREYLLILKDYFNIDESKLYNIAFFSEMTAENNKEISKIKYYNGKIIFPEHFFAQEAIKEYSSAKSLK